MKSNSLPASWVVTVAGGVFTATVLALALSACSPEKGPPNIAVRLGSFLDMERGTPIDSVRTTLGMGGKHEFSAAVQQTRYLGLYFAFKEPHVGFYLIFTNGYLKAVVDPPRPEFDRVPYKDTVREIPKPIDAEDRLKSVLASDDLAREELEQRIRNAMPKSASSLNMLPNFLIASPLYAALSGEIEADYRTNAELAKQYDPLKVKLGAPIEEVEQAFGQPYRVIEASEKQMVHVYGSPMPLRINPAYRFSWVTVVFEDGKAIRVLSNHFFDERLLGSER